MRSMISIAQKTQSFRDLHGRERGFIIPNPWDAGSARLLEGLGFEALATTSAGAAFSMGLPDGAISREAVLENARAICAAVSVPVNGDLLNGFGDAPETVAETIRLAAEAGLAGGSIEDTTGDPAKPLYDSITPSSAFRRRSERRMGLPQPFVLTARCDGLFARACTVEEAIRRILAYQAAGADVLYVPALLNLDQVRDMLAPSSARSTSSPAPDSFAMRMRCSMRGSSASASALRSTRPRWAPSCALPRRSKRVR